MRQYEMFEISLQGKEPEGSFVNVDVEAVFAWGDQEKKVKGFYAGEGIYKVRFLPTEEGLHTWKVTGAVAAEGQELCQAADSAHHGRVQAEDTHFVYEDGSLYRPFGTTIYAFAHQSDALIDQTIHTLETAPFNKVRYCVFPKDYDYNKNEPQYYAFEKDAEGNWDVNHPCMKFWDHFEKILFKMDEMGIQTDLILFHPYDRWGFSQLSMEDNLTYLEYVIRRFSAVPSIWWSMANEYDLMFNRGIEDWHVFEQYIADHDSFHHLLSNHQCIVPYDFSRENITHCCLQLGCVERAAEFIEKYKKPVIYDECAYEGNLAHDWGNISAFEMVNRFWCLYAQGAYATHGEVFLSEDDILWWARGGVLKGESPERIAFLKDLLEHTDGPVVKWNPKEFAPEEERGTMLDKLKGQREDSPLIYAMNHPTEEQKGFVKGMFKHPEYTGRIGKDFFIRYFYHTCPAIHTMYLPEDASYKIEVIDVWEMTRKQIYFDASGKVVFSLPGKEGIAVIATRVH